MKIYLAARYPRFLEMQDYAAMLESLGHVVTSRWIRGSHSLEGVRSSQVAEECTRLAIEDYTDLFDAECCVSFTEAPVIPHVRGGRHVEFGIALVLKKRLIVVGHRENVFHYLPQVEFYKTWKEALAGL
jgi:hypothetical protein